MSSSEQVLLEARRQGEAPVGEAEPSAAEIKIEAERAAEALVNDAEQRASEIVAAAELTRARLEQETALERKLVDDKREELSALLLDFLEQVRRASPDGKWNVFDLHEARETRSNRASLGD